MSLLFFLDKSISAFLVEQYYFYHWQSETKVETQVVIRETEVAGDSMHSRQFM